MNLPKNIILELYGLPGCGKSTLTQTLLSILQKEYPDSVLSRVDLLSSVSKYWNRPYRLLLFLILELLKPKSYKTKAYLLKYALSFPINRYSVKYLMYTLLAINSYRKNKTKILVLDEGIIQFLSSLPHNQVIKNTKLIERISKQINEWACNVVFVECQLDREATMQRIKERNRRDRFAYNDSLEGLLKIKETNLALLSNEIAKNKIIVDMRESSNNNAERIINRIHPL